MNRNVMHSLFYAIALLAFRVEAGSSILTSKQIAAIHVEMRRALTEDGLPSLSVAVGINGTIWSDAVGAADLEQYVPATTKTLYRTASISKWITATTALKLVEQGKLDLDIPVQRYCAQYPEKEWPITSRMLLSHLAGLRNYYGANGEKPKSDAERNQFEERRRQELQRQFLRHTDAITPLDTFKDDPLMFQPGTHFHYSSLNYRLLACVMEGASQRSYRQLVRDLIFRPAGMQDTTEDDAMLIIPHRAALYSIADGKLIRAPFRDVSENLPAGGHLSTAGDLVRFAIAFDADKLIKSGTRDIMLSQAKMADGSPAPEVDGQYYAMGVIVSRTAHTLTHSGAQSGTTTLLVLYPKRAVAVAVMTNVDGWKGREKVAGRVADIVQHVPEASRSRQSSVQH